MAIITKNICIRIFQFFDKKHRLTDSATQGENYPTRPMWIMIAFHIGTYVYMTLGMWALSLGEMGQNVEGPH